MLIPISERAFFPITSLDGFLKLIEEHINNSQDDGPNLAYLSILFGYLEHELTVNQPFHLNSDNDLLESFSEPDNHEKIDEFPVLLLTVVEKLFERFVLILKAQVDKSLTDFTTRSGFATKRLCKHVSDVIWNGLLRSYHKDKAHIQSIFSYLTSKQLDCFGLAFTVVASCQVLNYCDVHLVISGDHSWVCYGDGLKNMVEVTWHGKGTEDRRGFVINDSVSDKKWIYHNGKAVKCNRWMEFASLIVSLNPLIDSHAVSKELQFIQWKILQGLYNRGHLDQYPMALGIFCELHESIEESKLPLSSLDKIHDKAVSAVRDFYGDTHVYPYCSKAHFHRRNGQCKKAIECYAKAAQVLSRYNYTKDDEEIYKDMMDIANELIPQVLRDEPSLLDDPECYFQVVRFYDGICVWEEDSATPILHSWWVRYFTGSLNRFAAEARQHFKDDPVDDDSSRVDDRSRKMRFTDLSESVIDTGKNDDDEEKSPVSKLCLRSHKMSALRESLTSGRRMSSQAVTLLLTAQSQVAKRKSESGKRSPGYSPTRRKRTRDSRT